MTFKKINFSKMHGLGNDYIVIDEMQEEIIPESKKNEVCATLCRRGFSIGADGVIFITTPSETIKISNSNDSEKTDIRFRIFNSDGSEAEMCGNGIRCFAKYVYDRRILKKDRFIVETLGGVKIIDMKIKNGKVASSKVDMGKATFKVLEVPMISDSEEFLDQELIVKGNPYQLSAVSVGNPHAVIFVDDLKKVPLNDIGPAIETHQAFPQKTNVHFVKILSKNEIEITTWERGAGYTYACGTGATSCALVGFKLGKLDDNVLVHLPGGDLQIEVYEKEGALGAFMEGDAVLVFDGIMKIKI